MPGSPAFYTKISLWTREGALEVLDLHFNKAFSTVSHNMPALSSGCYSPHNNGAENLAGCPGSALWAGGWAGTILQVLEAPQDPSPHTWDRAAGQRDGQEPAEFKREQDRGLPSQGRSPCSCRLGAQASLGPGRGKGEHEPAGPRLFELGTEMFGPGAQPVEGKGPPQFTSSFLCALSPHTRTRPNLSLAEDQQCPGAGAHAWEERLKGQGLFSLEKGMVLGETSAFHSSTQ